MDAEVCCVAADVVVCVVAADDCCFSADSCASVCSISVVCDDEISGSELFCCIAHPESTNSNEHIKIVADLFIISPHTVILLMAFIAVNDFVKYGTMLLSLVTKRAAFQQLRIL